MSQNLWLSLFSSGVAAARPTTPEVAGLSCYYETDTGVISLWTGSAWQVLYCTGVQQGVTASTTHTLVGATQITAGFVNITTCTLNDTVKLPPSPRVGQWVEIQNNGAAACAVFPGESGSTIDGGSAGASVTLTNGKSATYECVAANTWVSIGMATKSA